MAADTRQSTQYFIARPQWPAAACDQQMMRDMQKEILNFHVGIHLICAYMETYDGRGLMYYLCCFCSLSKLYVRMDLVK
jgi:hypothetical protein